LESRNRIDRNPYTWIYPGNRSENRCNITLYRRGNGAVILASEIIDDPKCGVSITNGAEYIANQIMYEYDLSANFIIWIEHYPQRGPFNSFPETWDLVQFNYDAGKHCFFRPRWMRINQAAVTALIGT
jgi:hypothetical protein